MPVGSPPAPAVAPPVTTIAEADAAIQGARTGAVPEGDVQGAAPSIMAAGKAMCSREAVMVVEDVEDVVLADVMKSSVVPSDGGEGITPQ